MRPSKKHAPYSLYKKQTKSGLFWYVRFWNVEAKAYNIVRSTGIKVEGKKERWREADDTARTLLNELQQESIKPYSIKNQMNLPIETTDLKNEADISFIQYLLDFWSPESEYSQYKRDVKKKPLSVYYIQMNHDDVVRHIASFQDFENITLKDLNRVSLKKWLICMSKKRVTYIKKDGTLIEGNLLSGRRINSILQTMRTAVRWAIDNEVLTTDPFKRLDEVTEESKEKGILTSKELGELIALPVKDPYSRLVVLLAARCGMRRGEVRGLKWGDIDFENGIITIQHNFVNADGLKSPKIKGGIIVKNSSPVPLPTDVESVLNIVRNFTDKTSDNDYVIQSFKYGNMVISGEYFRSAFARELRSIGIDENTQKERNLTYHSLRHTFVSLGRASGLNSFEIQTLARHKSIGMVDRYSHGKQAIDFIEARKKIEASVHIVNCETQNKVGNG